jgi:hypothetical protein
MSEVPATRVFDGVRTLSRYDWRLLVVAIIELAFARVRHAALPVATILADLQIHHARTMSPKLTATDIARLSWAIAAAARRVPWRADCLLQAMAAHSWLRRKGLQAQVFVGVRKDDHGDLTAHAWSRHGELTITGGRHDEFHVMLGPASLAR